jgi:Tfp pilus assembly protein PilW
MSSSRRSDRRGAARGITLLEVVCAQAIVLIVIAGMLSLFVPLMRHFNDEEGLVDARIKLREATDLFSRDVQSIGGADGRAGYLFVRLSDGGATAPDSFRVFKRLQGVCTGSTDPGALIAADPFSTDTAMQLVAGACPIAATGNCTPAILVGRKLLLRGPRRSIPLLVTSADPITCHIGFGDAASNAAVVTEYNTITGTALTSITDVLSDVLSPADYAAGKRGIVVVGSTFEYRVQAEALERSVNGGPFTPILSGVYDLQVVNAYDANGDQVISANELDDAGPVVGASPESFFGAQIGVITFGAARAGLNVPPPATFGNRTLTSPPGGRRYRTTTVFTAARNR